MNGRDGKLGKNSTVSALFVRFLGCGLESKIRRWAGYVVAQPRSTMAHGGVEEERRAVE